MAFPYVLLKILFSTTIGIWRWIWEFRVLNSRLNFHVILTCVELHFCSIFQLAASLWKLFLWRKISAFYLERPRWGSLCYTLSVIRFASQYCIVVVTLNFSAKVNSEVYACDSIWQNLIKQGFPTWGRRTPRCTRWKFKGVRQNQLGKRFFPPNIQELLSVNTVRNLIKASLVLFSFGHHVFFVAVSKIFSGSSIKKGLMCRILLNYATFD